MLLLLQDHPKDAEFLNVPIVNYTQMQTTFGTGVATGRFVMGSGEALGVPAEQETIDVDKDAPQAHKEDGHDGKETNDGKKRKRMLSEEDQELLTGVTDAIWGLGAAVSEGNHAEAAPGIYDAVMNVPNFTRAQLMKCLNYLNLHKVAAFVFVGMKPEDQELWCSLHLMDTEE